MSSRLHFIVEGQTEESFVNQVLVPHLAKYSIWSKARCVTTNRRCGVKYRGGIGTYLQAKSDVVLWMKEDQNPDAYFTTMFDLYALPEDFPGYSRARGQCDPYERVAILEDAMQESIKHPRFVPYIQLHEFETLLLADPQKLSWQFPAREAAIQNLITLTSSFESPELIDDGRDTAPSKRIITELPEFDGMKASAGPLVAERIGVHTLKEKCRHFGEWLARLEGLGRAVE